MYYTLNEKTVKEISEYWNKSTSNKKDCICHEGDRKTCSAGNCKK
jgi:hypothetical protein